MSNLDNLIAKINEDSIGKSDLILSEAKASAEKITKSKLDEASAKAAQILEAAKNEAAREKDQIIAGKRLELRDKKLLAKQEVIGKTFKAALSKLKAMDLVNFQKFLETYILCLDIDGSESLILPEKFENIDLSDINKKLQEKGKQGALSVLKGSKTIDSGFIVVKNGIENNNTFESLIDFYKEELEVTVAQNLF